MKRLISYTVLAFGLAAGSSSAVQQDEFQAVTGSFLKELQAQAANDPAMELASRKLALKLDALQGAGLVDASALTNSLRAIHPEFGDALKTAASDPTAGIELLGKLAESEDPFLAAEAGYYRSRLLIGAERFEEALPHLEKLRTDWSKASLRTGESLYYQGVCNANMLQRTAASDNLNGFVENYPNSSPRLLGAAWDLIASLERVHRGSIDDVASHMEFSRRKLGLTDAGEVTQGIQSRIVVMLDELIAMAEEQEKQQPP